MSRLVWAALLAAATSGGHAELFAPAHRLTGIGAARADMSDELLAARTRLMIESQTFAILRDPRAAQGAERVLKYEKLFEDAERRTGWPAEVLSAIAYLESFGDPNAQSPTGPKGLMQISGATAKAMGLRMIYATQYRVTTQKKQIRGKGGKITTKTVKVKTPFNVLIRDERMVPERAIPAAAAYLARLDNNLGGRDWAIFAYHCGPGCVGNMQELTEAAKGIKKPITVAKMFFGANPAFNRELYLEIKRQMDRDYSPTYWFRVMRAIHLLGMYKEDRQGFLDLVEQYKYEPDPSRRAHDRLACWLKPKDLVYQSSDDLKREQGKSLVKAFDDPAFFGFTLRKSGRGAIGTFDLTNQDFYLQGSPSAIGTLTYIAFETRRLHELMKPKGEKFVPLEVTSLVKPVMSPVHFFTGNGETNESVAHSSGQVFDINFGDLPPGELEALQFVLDDMGWEGYLGFVEESPNSGLMHIGCSPSSRAFFTQVFQEALDPSIKAAKH
jgi:hypothetical protein